MTEYIILPNKTRIGKGYAIRKADKYSHGYSQTHSLDEIKNRDEWVCETCGKTPGVNESLYTENRGNYMDSPSYCHNCYKNKKAAEKI